MRNRPEVTNLRDCFPYNPSVSTIQNTGSLPDTEQDDSFVYIENAERLGNTNWCLCGHCKPMPSIMESICCHDEPAIYANLPTEDGCIIHGDKFKTEFLVKERADWAYKITNFKLQKQPKEDKYMRGLRQATYRSFSVWIYGYLGTGVRKVIPSCAVHAIRDAYPDPNGKYVGFLNAYDYPAEFMIDY
ncbi:P2X purinoceptor 7-like isoform X2 [Xenopus laevis]|nr:P2X purinoceptor 7-like isoform X2 [Xenopus laevis]